jgi:hypothetical protein
MDEDTDTLLTSLMHQLVGINTLTLAKKHGENVITGSGGVVKPGHLAPIWSAHERNAILSGRNPRQGGR